MKILFICTDNYTRSVTAEFCLMDYLEKTNNNDIEVASAGFKADSDLSKFSNIHFDRMNELGINTSGFKRTQFNERFFDEFDVMIAMGVEHKDYISQKYNKKIYLFNEIYKDEERSLVIPPPDENGTYSEEIKRMVDYVHNAMPDLVRKLKGEKSLT